MILSPSRRFAAVVRNTFLVSHYPHSEESDGKGNFIFKIGDYAFRPSVVCKSGRCTGTITTTHTSGREIEGFEIEFRMWLGHISIPTQMKIADYLHHVR